MDGSEFTPVSHRQQIWSVTDPSRTGPAGHKTSTWPAYVLGAQVMMHDRDGRIVPYLDELTFDDCLGGSDPPTMAELDRHITTLFPP